MARRGHVVCTITQNVEGQRNQEDEEGVRIFRVGPRIRYGGQTPPGILDNLGYVLAALIKGLRVIKEHKIAIIHSNTYAPVFSAALCALVMRKPWIITVHDVLFLQGNDFWGRWASQRGVSRAVGIIGPLAEKSVLRLSPNVFHTVSQQSKEDLSCNGVTNVRVISNGIDIQEYESDTETAPNKQFVYVGRLVNYKNLEVVIEAMKYVVKQIPDARLVIVGDGPHRASLENLTENYSLRENVIFTGFVPHEQKVKLLRESAFLVLPSIAEGFGVVVIEAFACGRPALVSNLGSLKELVTDGVDGKCIPPFDSTLWSRAILQLLRDRQGLAAMGRNALVKAKKYSLERTVDRMERLYSELITGLDVQQNKNSWIDRGLMSIRGIEQSMASWYEATALHQPLRSVPMLAHKER